MWIEALDHFVLTVRDIEATAAFYARALGVDVVRWRQGGVERVALHFGAQKINLHQVGQEIPLRAALPAPGTGDFCFVTRKPLP
ncbi:MAG TPA: VOC family protein, partial [Bacillota bacterium]